MTTETMMHRIAERGRYESADAAWLAFLRWALVEAVLPARACQRALRLMEPTDPLTNAEAAGMTTEQLLARVVGFDLLAAVAEEKWFNEWQERRDVRRVIKLWAKRPGQAVEMRLARP